MASEQVLYHITGNDNIGRTNVDDLSSLVKTYPYFSPAQYLLALKQKQENSYNFPYQLQKASLYFSNPSWLLYQLDEKQMDAPVLSPERMYAAPVIETVEKESIYPTSILGTHPVVNVVELATEAVDFQQDNYAPLEQTDSLGKDVLKGHSFQQTGNIEIPSIEAVKQMLNGRSVKQPTNVVEESITEIVETASVSDILNEPIATVITPEKIVNDNNFSFTTDEEKGDDDLAEYDSMVNNQIAQEYQWQPAQETPRQYHFNDSSEITSENIEQFLMSDYGASKKENEVFTIEKEDLNITLPSNNFSSASIQEDHFSTESSLLDRVGLTPVFVQDTKQEVTETEIPTLYAINNVAQTAYNEVPSTTQLNEYAIAYTTPPSRLLALMQEMDEKEKLNTITPDEVANSAITESRIPTYAFSQASPAISQQDITVTAGITVIKPKTSSLASNPIPVDDINYYREVPTVNSKMNTHTLDGKTLTQPELKPAIPSYSFKGFTDEPLEEVATKHNSNIGSSLTTSIEEEDDLEAEAAAVGFEQPNQHISSMISNQVVDFKAPLEKDAKFDFENEPYHTIDYFASLGIKIDLTKQPQDKLTMQLRRFTDWLKQMKKVDANPNDLGTDPELEKAIQNIAKTSLEAREIVTETMADVFIKQGKVNKAIQLYIKLSFLEPNKSTYFATKIQQLKGI